MENLNYELAENLSKICFIVRSMQRIFAAGPSETAEEDLESAADLLQELAEKSLKSIRTVI